jgi:hypothetical protein
LSPVTHARLPHANEGEVSAAANVSGSSQFEQLPLELQGHIAQFLEPRDHAALAQVNNPMKKLVADVRQHIQEVTIDNRKNLDTALATMPNLKKVKLKGLFTDEDVATLPKTVTVDTSERRIPAATSARAPDHQSNLRNRDRAYRYSAHGQDRFDNQLWRERMLSHDHDHLRNEFERQRMLYELRRV